MADTKTATIAIVNKIETGTAFGVTLGAQADAVFVPGKVADAARAEVGDQFVALLVPNTVRPERTPWMAIRIDSALPLPAPEPDPALPSIGDMVRETLRGGGVWTLGELFHHLFSEKSRGESLREYNAVDTALRTMFANGECAKFQLWRSTDQGRASREWFTCYPEKADVDEWEG